MPSISSTLSFLGLLISVKLNFPESKSPSRLLITNSFLQVGDFQELLRDILNPHVFLNVSPKAYVCFRYQCIALMVPSENCPTFLISDLVLHELKLILKILQGLWAQVAALWIEYKLIWLGMMWWDKVQPNWLIWTAIDLFQVVPTLTWLGLTCQF